MRSGRAGIGRAALLLATGLAVSGAAPGTDMKDACVDELVYFGTQQTGAGAGIQAARLDTRSGTLSVPTAAAPLERPTWVLADPKRPVLYAVSEVGNDGKSQAAVASFAIDPHDGTLRQIGAVPSGGGGATHLALAHDGGTLFVANYGTGQVAALPVSGDGTLSPAVAGATDTGSGPSPRQRGPHAHAVTPDPTSHYLLVADLGADRVFTYRIDRAPMAFSLVQAQSMPPGTGPRHLAFRPDGRFVYLTSELAGTVTAFGWNAATGALSPVQTLDNTAADYHGARSASEIAVSANGAFLYAANRGEDTIVVYAIDRGTGRLTLAQRVPAGAGPWSFRLDPSGHWLIVADQRANAVAVFAVDPRSGRLKPSGAPMTIDKPVSIAFARGAGCR